MICVLEYPFDTWEYATCRRILNPSRQEYLLRNVPTAHNLSCPVGVALQRQSLVKKCSVLLVFSFFVAKELYIVVGSGFGCRVEGCEDR